MFLRRTCILPDGIDLAQRNFSDEWMSVEETTSTILDAKVRSYGWNFIWLKDHCSRFAFGRTDKVAVARATARALDHIKRRFNTAELGEARISRYPGFRCAKVTIHARHIQQEAMCRPIGEMTIGQFAVR
jgi:hypothetical protein